MSKDTATHKTRWKITKYETPEDHKNDKPYEEVVVEDNILLNEGINLVLDLLLDAGGTQFTNLTSYLGVGDGTTAAEATQTGLLGSNQAYSGMEAGYPQRNDQTITWRAVFGPDVAVFDWREFTVANSNSNDGINLNRRVDETQGTKGQNQTWTLDLEIMLS